MVSTLLKIYSRFFQETILQGYFTLVWGIIIQDMNLRKTKKETKSTETEV